MRFTLSDGESTVLAMMNKQVFDKMDGQTIPQNSVIQLFTFIKQSIQNRVILVLSRPPKVIYPDVTNRIGSPKDYEQIKKDGFPENSGLDISISKETLAKYGFKKNGQPLKEGDKEDIEMDNTQDDGKDSDGGARDSGNKVHDQFSNEPYTPIKALSTFNYDWRIKARVTKKGQIRRWKNNRSEGYLLNVDLMDKHGTQIQATFFKDAVDRFESII